MPAKVATFCDDNKCTELLVRGDKVSFVSLEMADSLGCHEPACDLHLRDDKMPSDIDMISRSFVLVHDTEAAVLPRCQLYVLRWRGGKTRDASTPPSAVAEYFGNERPKHGAVEIPEGPWKKVCKVRFIRYTRYGVGVDPNDRTNVVMRPGSHIDYEHGFDPCAILSVCKKPLAWRLSLPNSCVINSHGFVSP